jgi:ribosomal protein S27AE
MPSRELRRFQMTKIIRHCPDCGEERLFAQHHSVAGWCPDALGSGCPEWYCLACGAALLIGTDPALSGRVADARVRDRVA